jgi:ElaB/YqjD/DUF883 family membrane-anchored ribosome-binding protein
MENVTQNLTEKIEDAQARIAPQIEEARQSLNEINERTTSWIRQNPGTALLAAVGLGFLVGKIASR